MDDNRADWDNLQHKAEAAAARKHRRIVRTAVAAGLVLALGFGAAGGFLARVLPIPPTVLRLLRAEMREGCRPIVLQGITDDEAALRAATRDEITEMTTGGVERISFAVGRTTSGDWYGLIVGYLCQ